MAEFPSSTISILRHIWKIKDLSEKRDLRKLAVEYPEWSKSPDEIRRKDGGTKLFFARILQSFLITGIDEFKRQLNTGKEQIAPGVYEDFRDELAVRLQNIALRTLIAEMHGYKQRGMLKGADSKEQYQIFANNVE